MLAFEESLSEEGLGCRQPTEPQWTVVTFTVCRAGAFVDLNQPLEEAVALYPPQGAWLEVTSPYPALLAPLSTWTRVHPASRHLLMLIVQMPLER